MRRPAIPAAAARPGWVADGRSLLTSRRGLNADTADTADAAEAAEAAGRTQAICTRKLRRGRRWRLPPFPALLPAPFLAPYQHAENRALVWPASATYRGRMATGIVILRKG